MQEYVSEEDARAYFQQMIMGLEYLHHHGVLHATLSQATCSLTGRRVRLKYATLAWLPSQARRKALRVLGEDDLIHGDECGTLAFRAPESFPGDDPARILQSSTGALQIYGLLESRCTSCCRENFHLGRHAPHSRTIQNAVLKDKPYSSKN